MKAIDYIYPIFEDAGGEEGVALTGNGFFVNDFFITADHIVSKYYFTPFIIVNGTKLLLVDDNKVELNYNSISYDGNDHPYGHEDDSKTDLAVFIFNNFSIKSPLRLSKSLPESKQELKCDFWHTIKDESNLSQESNNIGTLELYIWNTIGVVENNKEYFIGNFYGSRMTPSHPFKRSSGSPLYCDNNVYGILHAGKDDLCVFYSAAHAHLLLNQHKTKVAN